MIIRMRVVLWIVTCFNQIWSVRSVVIQAEEGGSALLPCLYSRLDPVLPKNPTVLWKDPSDKVLLRIGLNRTSPAGRVTTFPDVHAQGNFSIQIQDLVQTDSGQYECHITVVDFEKNIQLNVTGRKKLVQSYTVPEGGAEVSQISLCFLLMLTSCVYYLFL